MILLAMRPVVTEPAPVTLTVEGMIIMTLCIGLVLGLTISCLVRTLTPPRPQRPS